MEENIKVSDDKKSIEITAFIPQRRTVTKDQLISQKAALNAQIAKIDDLLSQLE